MRRFELCASAGRKIRAEHQYMRRLELRLSAVEKFRTKCPTGEKV
jgi:hypothetical protein